MFQMLPILAWFGRMPSSFGWKALGVERPTIPPLGSCSVISLEWKKLLDMLMLGNFLTIPAVRFLVVLILQLKSISKHPL